MQRIRIENIKVKTRINCFFRHHSELEEGAMKSSLFFIKFLENSNAAYFELQCKSPSGKKKSDHRWFIPLNHFIVLGSFQSF